MKRTATSSSRPARLAALAAAGSLLLLTSSVVAQATAPETLQPPIPAPPLTAASHPLQVAIAILLLALVVGANMIPSKRGHQD